MARTGRSIVEVGRRADRTRHNGLTSRSRKSVGPSLPPVVAAIAVRTKLAPRHLSRRSCGYSATGTRAGPLGRQVGRRPAVTRSPTARIRGTARTGAASRAYTTATALPAARPPPQDQPVLLRATGQARPDPRHRDRALPALECHRVFGFEGSGNLTRDIPRDYSPRGVQVTSLNLRFLSVATESPDHGADADCPIRGAPGGGRRSTAAGSPRCRLPHHRGWDVRGRRVHGHAVPTSGNGESAHAGGAIQMTAGTADGLPALAVRAASTWASRCSV